jgi:hypothetical protein
MGKLLSKVLANRLSTRLPRLVHHSQSALIVGHYIQDNFHFVQAAAKLLHGILKACFQLKVDIAQTFDSVAWPFLLEVLEFMGFSMVWCDSMLALLSTASTRILLNGAMGNLIFHSRNLCQSDPLSLMLFLLVMEVLSALICKADQCSLLEGLSSLYIPHCATFYVGDMILFICPEAWDLQVLWEIFDMFEGASSLSCNLSKCQMGPIRCMEEESQMVVAIFPCQLVEFPIRYL